MAGRRDRHRHEGAAGGPTRRGQRPAQAHSAAPWAPTSLIERAALLVLLAMIPLRAVLAETHSFESPRILRGLDTPPTAQPATTFLIVAAIVALFVVVACTRWWSGAGRYRWTGAECGAVLLLAAGGVATVCAGQKHLALIGTLDFIGLIIYMIALRQVLSRRWHIRLALAVIAATAAMVVAKAAWQVAVEHKDTQAYFEEYHQERLEQRAGIEGSAGRLHDFEQRLRGRLATSYFAHPNALGSFAVLSVLGCLAIVTGRFGRRPAWTLVLPAGVAGGACVTLWLSGSKGGAAALGIAGAVFVAGHALRRRLVRRPGSTVVAIWIVGAVVAVGLVAALWSNPEAMGRSMLFRQFYWDGAWRLLMDQGPWGIGPDNFGRWFTEFKAVQCPEEVQSPHSWVVRLAAEWGIAGLAGLLLVFAGVSRRLAGAPNEDQSESGETGSVGAWALGIMGLVVLGWVLVLSGSGLDFIVWNLIVAVPVWCAVFGIVAMESPRAALFTDDGLGPVLAGIVAAIVGFIAHTSIDLAMFVPGAATTFFALAAIGLAVRGGFPAPAPVRPRRRTAAGVGVVGGLAVAALLWGAAVPSATAAGLLYQARRAAAARPLDRSAWERMTRSYEAARDAYALDGTAASEWAEIMIARFPPAGTVDSTSARAMTDEIVRTLAELELRDPRNSGLHQKQSTAYYQRYRHTGDAADLERAVVAMRAAVERYPTSPNRWIFLGRLLDSAAEGGDRSAAAEAASAYRRALELDRQRIYVSAPNRLPESDVDDLESRIVRLDAAQRQTP